MENTPSVAGELTVFEEILGRLDNKASTALLLGCKPPLTRRRNRCCEAA